MMSVIRTYIAYSFFVMEMIVLCLYFEESTRIHTSKQFMDDILLKLTKNVLNSYNMANDFITFRDISL
jgi:hypothetical protein